MKESCDNCEHAEICIVFQTLIDNIMRNKSHFVHRMGAHTVDDVYAALGRCCMVYEKDVRCDE